MKSKPLRHVRLEYYEQSYCVNIFLKEDEEVIASCYIINKTIYGIFVKETRCGNGFGTQILKAAIAKGGRQLVAGAYRHRKMTTEQLVEWYKRHGFVFKDHGYGVLE